MPFQQPITAGKGGGANVSFSADERDLLVHIAEMLAEIITGVTSDTRPDRVLAKLFPRAYEDPLEQMQFADSMTTALAEHKSEQLERFTKSLQTETPDEPFREFLSPDEVTAWMAVLQDARVMFAQRLEIETDADMDHIDVEDPAAAVLEYLGWLLQMLVGITMNGWSPDGPVS